MDQIGKKGSLRNSVCKSLGRRNEQAHVEDSEKIKLYGAWDLGEEMGKGPGVDGKARDQCKRDIWDPGPIRPFMTLSRRVRPRPTTHTN